MLIYRLAHSYEHFYENRFQILPETSKRMYIEISITKYPDLVGSSAHEMWEIYEKILQNINAYDPTVVICEISFYFLTPNKIVPKFLQILFDESIFTIL